MNRWKTALFIVLAVGALLLAACAPRTDTAPADGGEATGEMGRPVRVGNKGVYRDISIKEFQSMLENKDFLLINVHIPFAGNIPDTDLAIPFNQVAQYADQLPEDKNAKIVVYCRSGAMSAQAARTLVEMGYTNVWNVSGGMIAWTQAGLPLVNTGPQPQLP